MHTTTGAATKLLSAKGVVIRVLPGDLLKGLIARGLVTQNGDCNWQASKEAFDYLTRSRSAQCSFLSQHVQLAVGDAGIADTRTGGQNQAPGRARPRAVRNRIGNRSSTGSVQCPLINRDESPVANLARRRNGGHNPFLDPAAVTAADRFRSDFERGICVRA
ncbi:MAG: DUF6456 domain-containing protein [Alphaproteobacteria bacterium]